MKKLIAIVSLLTILTPFAITKADTMTVSDQDDLVIEIAKELRRDFWVSGHQDVNSYEEKITLDFLNDYVKKESNHRYESPLSRDEISSLYSCFHRKGCEVYFIGVSAEYWGGYGETGNFVLLNTSNRKYEMISHTIYAE